MSAEARWLDRHALAAYLSIPVGSIRRHLRSGKLPLPSYHLGTKSPRWDRLALDARLSGGVASKDAGAAVQGLIQSILAEPKARRRR